MSALRTPLLLILAVCIAAFAIDTSPVRAGTEIVTDDSTAIAKPSRRTFVLTDGWGRTISDDDLIGHYLLVYFGYTFCPDVCPTSMITIAEVLDKLGDDASRIVPLFISVDPKRDTPKHLREYTSMFDERIIGLTGKKEFIDAAVDAYNVRYEIVEADPNDPDNYTIDHSSSVAFVAPDGRIITRFGHGLTTDEIVRRIKKTFVADPLQN
ncbi:MAG: SCO family protein [Hyphomicrobiales bacterium]|nr:MAG: SCO family protein [Hyphomicrobiales bacterium]